MKNILCIVFIIFISSISHAQQSFEGLIKFRTEITSSENDFEKKLIEKYGDSLIVYYSANGGLKRQYLNTGKDGNDLQIYDPNKGLLYLKNKNSSKFDSIDVKINSITKVISTKKINNEKIMGLDCECIEFIGVSKYNQHVVINYCYNLSTPKVDSTFFSKHSDFFLDEYFKSSERPYLKFSIQTEQFKISQLATEIRPLKIDSQFFIVR